MSDTKQIALASPVVRKLSSIAVLIRNYVIVESLLWIAIWILILFWVGGLIDYLQ